MDIGKSKWKNNSMIKKLVLSLSFQSGRAKSSRILGDATSIALSKSKSWHCATAEKSQEHDHGGYRTRHKVAPQGCFSVYVGPEKQRFVIKAKYANHPLFKMLLEDAELEYGYSNGGPLLLPCDVDIFYKILAEMDSGKLEVHDSGGGGGGFAYGSCSPFSPARRLRNGTMSRGCNPYGRLTPPRLLKMNHF